MKRGIALTLILILCAAALCACGRQVDDGTAVITVNGDPITKGEIDEGVRRSLRWLQTYRSVTAPGEPFDADDPAIVSAVRENVMQDLVRERVIAQKMKEYGVPPLTDAEREAALSPLMQYAIPLGYDPEDPASEDSILALVCAETEFGAPDETAAIADAADAKLMPVVTEGLVTVTEEDVTAGYNAWVREDQDTFTDPALLADALNAGETVLCYPVRVHRVNVIFVPFMSEDQSLLSECGSEIEELSFEVLQADEGGSEGSPPSDDRQAEAKRARLAALQSRRERLLADAYAAIRAEAVQAASDAAGGTDWATVAATHGGDPWFLEGWSAGKEYAMVEGCEAPGMGATVSDAAMSLTEIGEISGPVPGEYGYFILRLSGVDEPGPVPYETARGPVYAALYSERQREIYDAMVDRWILEADIVMDDHVYD